MTGRLSSSCAISGMTSKEVALVLAHAKFTNWPGAAKAGETLKLDTAKAENVPPALLAPLALIAELLDGPSAKASALNKHKLRSRLGTARSVDINVNP